MTDFTISTNDGAVQVAGGGAATGVDGARTAGGGIHAGVDPRIIEAGEDTNRTVDKNGRRTKKGADDARKDSKGKTQIDDDSSGKVRGVDDRFTSALNAFGKALGSGGSGAGSSMPQVPMSSTPQMPTAAAAAPAAGLQQTLSNPAALAQLASALNGDGAAGGGGGGGVQQASHGGGGGLFKSSTPGTNAQAKMLQLINDGVQSKIPYAYGGGTLDGPSNGGQGLNDVADQHGDYAKAGFDCSSWVRYLLYQGYGVEIPRTSEAQFAAGQEVSAADARFGDLLFPSTSLNGGSPSHVMMYIGDGKVTEAQSSGTTLMISDAPDGVYKRYVDDPELKA